MGMWSGRCGPTFEAFDIWCSMVLLPSRIVPITGPDNAHYARNDCGRTMTLCDKCLSLGRSMDMSTRISDMHCLCLVGRRQRQATGCFFSAIRGRNVALKSILPISASDPVVDIIQWSNLPSVPSNLITPTHVDWIVCKWVIIWVINHTLMEGMTMFV